MEELDRDLKLRNMARKAGVKFLLREVWRSIAPLLRTQDVGKCKCCEGYTSSGSIPLCCECAASALIIIEGELN